MPRGGRSSGGFGSNRSTSRSSSYGQRSTPSYSSRPPTTTNHQSTPVSQPSGGMMGGLGQTLVTGMAFGAGSEIAHQAVRSVMGGGSHGGHSEPKTVENQQPIEQNNQNNAQPKQNPCMEYNNKFIDCLRYNNNTISMCQSIFDDMKSCEKNLI